MKIPPFFLGTAVIFWGWQTGLWILAIPMAIILEASRWVNSRWDFSQEDFLRIANLSVMILLSLFIYLLINNRSFYLIYTLLQWLPIAGFPLIAAQIYSVNGGINVKTLFLLFDDAKTGETINRYSINLTYPYFFACIIAASNANTQNIWFYLVIFIITAIALSSVRSKRYSLIIWLCLMLTAGSGGFLGQMALQQLNKQLENQVVSWLSNNAGQEVDATKKQTSMGEVGALKQSNDIIFRVNSETKINSSLLLRQATYNKYQSSIWIAVKPDFIKIKPHSNGTTWELGHKADNSSMMTISGNFNQGKSLLRLPQGTFKIDNLPVSQMEKNKYGTIKVKGKINDFAYQVNYNNNLSFDTPPTIDDVNIPLQEENAVNKIVSKLKLQDKSPSQILKILERFFQTDFTYSLQLTEKNKQLTPVSSFLLQNRSGHCEYFAAATTLILRSVGIPARYTVGYSVHEFSNLEKQYIVRNRHAHAWTLVYINGKWQDFDTTPADWIEIENGTVSFLSSITDFFSFLGFHLSGCLRTIFGNNILKYGLWLILPFIFLRTWLSGKNSKVQRLSTQKLLRKETPQKKVNHRSSEFYLIEKALNDLGLVRHPAESFKNWMYRLKEELPTPDLIDGLTSIIELHYRERFDPQGINETERQKLKSAVQLWLKTYSTSRCYEVQEPLPASDEGAKM
jgi:protein-glutamine gamma-glutamyltransferase